MQELYYGAAIIAFIISGQFGLGIWLNSQFNIIRKEQIAIKEKLLTKLEYHEKHDDQRFADITNRLWEMKLDIAAKRGRFFDQKERNFSREDGEEKCSGS